MAVTAGCRFDWATSSRRRTLQCQREGCKRQVTLWRPGLLEELGTRGLLVGAARAEWERSR